MEIKPDKNIIAILRVLQNSQKPVGGTKIAKQLQAYGINLSPRTVRYYLALTDKAGFTRNLGQKRGRLITAEGNKEIGNSFVINKIGFMASKIDDLCYRMDFSLAKCCGHIMMNISVINQSDSARAWEPLRLVFQKGLSMGNFMAFGEAKSLLGDFFIPEAKAAIGTVCSVTINGIFLRDGIPVFSRFGGLLEMRNSQPVRFTEIIKYSGTTLDPLEIFIKGQMTSVIETARSGNGVIGASFREIPAVAIPQAYKIKKKLAKVGLDGILSIGEPGRTLLGIPVPDGRAAMIVVGGLNPLAACEEMGIKTRNLAMKTLFDFHLLSPYDQLGDRFISENN